MKHHKRSYKTKPRLRKRDWSATVGGFGLRAGFSYKSKRSLATQVKRIVHHDLETPQHSYLNEGSVNPLQSTHYTLNPIAPIIQGTNNYQRFGDEIHIDAIKCRFTMVSNSTSNPTHFRVMLVKNNNDYGSTTPAWVSGLGGPNLYINQAVGNACLSGIPDPKQSTFLYDKVYTLKPTISGQTVTTTDPVTIPINQKFVYETGTIFSKSLNYYFVVVPFQLGGSVGVTQIGSFVLNYDVIFKNSK